eukprot:m.247818 g.247818  ORF g.247818 m.247818 type:complete len:481 (-) comp17159_c0_seq9:169-1611(-)
MKIRKTCRFLVRHLTEQLLWTAVQLLSPSPSWNLHRLMPLPLPLQTKIIWGHIQTSLCKDNQREQEDQERRTRRRTARGRQGACDRIRRIPRLRRKPPPPLPIELVKDYSIDDDSDVIVHDLIGENAVYNVYAGEMPDPAVEWEAKPLVPVVVKHVRDPRNDDLLTVAHNEIQALYYVRGHPNITQLLGIHLKRQSAFLCLSTAQCSLQQLLRDARPLPGRPALIEQADLYQMMQQVSQALDYLETKNIIHRGICSQHVYVTEDGILQLGFFSIAISGDHDIVPESLLTDLLFVRWLAPECIADNHFSLASDVFAFGVLLWETFSYGQRPWAGFSNPEVAQNVSQCGAVLDRPLACPYHIYKIMLQCWKTSPQERPPAARLLSMIRETADIAPELPHLFFEPQRSPRRMGSPGFLSNSTYLTRNFDQEAPNAGSIDVFEGVEEQEDYPETEIASTPNTRQSHSGSWRIDIPSSLQSASNI